MFICQKTKKAIGPGISPVKVVVQTRRKTYENYNPKTKKMVYSEGTEIVKELVVSHEAYEQMIKNGEVK
jgi:hypothetical protein